MQCPDDVHYVELFSKSYVSILSEYSEARDWLSIEALKTQVVASNIEANQVEIKLLPILNIVNNRVNNCVLSFCAQTVNLLDILELTFELLSTSLVLCSIHFFDQTSMEKRDSVN